MEKEHIQLELVDSSDWEEAELRKELDKALHQEEVERHLSQFHPDDELKDPNSHAFAVTEERLEADDSSTNELDYQIDYLTDTIAYNETIARVIPKIGKIRRARGAIKQANQGNLDMAKYSKEGIATNKHGLRAEAYKDLYELASKLGYIDDNTEASQVDEMLESAYKSLETKYFAEISDSRTRKKAINEMLIMAEEAKQRRYSLYRKKRQLNEQAY